MAESEVCLFIEDRVGSHPRIRHTGKPKYLVNKDIYVTSGVWDMENAQIIPFKSVEVIAVRMRKCIAP
ncbi:hypothetical protein VN97_g11607 [Penicillium thymicola]|uniref:Uncharacterized protein n=1 Tax=Penicillium thymicola TaxID=293382 RepID=A0AAI9T7R8_PENTH|nr:hypothetical protein VN97_g11607 [Penicillium thymicola]